MKSGQDDFIIVCSCLPGVSNTLIAVPALFVIKYPMSRIVENILQHGPLRRPCPMCIV